MKKIIVSIFVLTGLISYGFVSVVCASNTESCDGRLYYDNNTKCCPKGMIVINNKKCCSNLNVHNEKNCCEQGVGIRNGNKCLLCTSLEAKTIPNYKTICSEDLFNCSPKQQYIDPEGLSKCCDGIVEIDPKTQQKVCVRNLEGNLGINIDTNCLTNGQCSFNIYKTLGIRKSDQNPSVSVFVSDIILGVTMFLGTVISVILLVSGVLYILSAMQGKDSLADSAKKGIINSIIGLLLVTGSYGIVRLIQFLATGGS